MPKRVRDNREALIGELAVDPEFAAGYLNAAMEDSERIFLRALRDVAMSHQMAAVAHRAGLSRESLYRTLSEAGNPTLRTLRGVLDAVGLRIKIEATASSVSVDQSITHLTTSEPT